MSISTFEGDSFFSYYMESFNAEKQAPEEWFMPEMPKAKDLDDIEEGVAPF